MEGRVALVTGGSRGIGRAIALSLAEAGADIAVNYRRDEAAAQATVEEIEKLGRTARAYQGSVADLEDCQRLVADVLKDFGKISILINNAGIASRGNTIADTDPAEFERVIRTHTFGPFYMSHLVAPHMRDEPRGDIIVISSVATRYMSANGAPYSMGKAGSEAMAFTLAKEERKYGTRVNVVAPGLTVTDMGDRLSKAAMGVKEDIHELDAAAPFGHVCTPEEVASVVRFLVSDDNSYATGQKIELDGGGR